MFFGKKILEKAWEGGGTPAKEFRKIFFNPNMLTHISVDAAFDGDHENHSHIFI